MTRSGANISRRTSATDCYSTPRWATEALLDREVFPGRTLEPADGQGEMSCVLAYHGLKITCSDIEPLRHMSARTVDEPVDFLSDYFDDGSFDNVVTNPPFSKAMEFVQKALLVATNKVAMFLRIQFLESRKRYEWFKASPLKAVYVFSERCSLAPFGQEECTGSNGTACHAWFVWDHSWEGEPVIRWIPPREKGALEKILR